MGSDGSESGTPGGSSGRSALLITLGRVPSPAGPAASHGLPEQHLQATDRIVPAQRSAAEPPRTAFPSIRCIVPPGSRGPVFSSGLISKTQNDPCCRDPKVLLAAQPRTPGFSSGGHVRSSGSCVVEKLARQTVRDPLITISLCTVSTVPHL